MKVLFINPGKEMGGIQCLSAFLKQGGHETALINDSRLFDNPWVSFPRLARYADLGDEVVKQAIDIAPDLIAFSVVSDDFQWALTRARQLKAALGVPVVFGNIHPTSEPEQTLSHPEVDFIVRGEGEYPLLGLADALEKHHGFDKVRGLGYRSNGQVVLNELHPLIQDLDELPFPDKDFTYEVMPYLNRGYTTMTGRGCPYRCTFCDNTTSMNLYREAGQKGRWPRRHSPEYVVREILWAKERYGIDHVRFNDEDFSYDKNWTRRFCELYKKEVDIPYFAWVYPNTIDEEIATLMAESGCDSVEMGVQSGSARLRNEVMHRRTPEENILRAMHAFRKVGIKCTVDMIVGLPTETIEDLDISVDLINRGRPYHLYAFWMRYYASTEILNIAKERAVLSPAEIAQIRDGNYGRGSIAGGTTREKNVLAHRYHTLLVMTPILPQRFVSWLLRRNFVRFMPRVNPFLIVNITKLLHPNPLDEFARRERGLWRFELPRTIRKMIRRVLRLEPMPEPTPTGTRRFEESSEKLAESA
ncbi:MAG: B12-binding domain-containing radical SAM protein [Chrysiogenetes bacterium]|nr:B12-binding domain-containing radical SAM protein [Chrysiogenetes bacterium]